MSALSDIAGSLLWSIPLSDMESRSKYIKDLELEIETLRSLKNKNAQQGISYFNTEELLNVSSVNFPEPKELFDQIDSEEIDQLIVSLSSIVNAVKNGKPGQSVLSATLIDGVLYGYVASPETGNVISTSKPVENILSLTEPKLYGLFIAEHLQKWSKEKDAVIAWGAVRAFCDVEFPNNISMI